MKEEYQVGQTIKIKNDEFVISRVWQWATFTDFDIINKKTGKYGYFRIMNYKKPWWKFW